MTSTCFSTKRAHFNNPPSLHFSSQFPRFMVIARSDDEWFFQSSRSPNVPSEEVDGMRRASRNGLHMRRSRSHHPRSGVISILTSGTPFAHAPPPTFGHDAHQLHRPQNPIRLPRTKTDLIDGNYARRCNSSRCEITSILTRKNSGKIVGKVRMVVTY